MAAGRRRARDRGHRCREPPEAAPRSAAQQRLDPAGQHRRGAGRTPRRDVLRLPAGSQAEAGRHPAPRPDPVLVHPGAGVRRRRAGRHARPGRLGRAGLGLSGRRPRGVRRDAAGRSVLRPGRRADLRRTDRGVGDPGGDCCPGRLGGPDQGEPGDGGCCRRPVLHRRRRDHSRPDRPVRGGACEARRPDDRGRGALRPHPGRRAGGRARSDRRQHRRRRGRERAVRRPDRRIRRRAAPRRAR